MICRLASVLSFAVFLATPFPPTFASPSNAELTYTVAIDGVETKVTPKQATEVELKGQKVEITLSEPREQKKQVTFELTIAGEAFEVELGIEKKLKSASEGKKNYRVLVTRWYPTYVMGPIRFQHPEGATLEDDRTPVNRSVTIELGDDSIDVMDGRPNRNAKSLARSTGKIFAAEVSEDPAWVSSKPQSPKQVKFAKASGWGVSVQSVDDEGDTMISEFIVLESRRKLLIVTLTYWEEDKKAYYEKFQMLLDSVEFSPKQ